MFCTTGKKPGRPAVAYNAQLSRRSTRHYSGKYGIPQQDRQSGLCNNALAPADLPGFRAGRGSSDPIQPTFSTDH
jgi:hypothetical protein